VPRLAKPQKQALSAERVDVPEVLRPCMRRLSPARHRSRLGGCYARRSVKHGWYRDERSTGWFGRRRRARLRSGDGLGKLLRTIDLCNTLAIRSSDGILDMLKAGRGRPQPTLTRVYNGISRQSTAARWKSSARFRAMTCLAQHRHGGNHGTRTYFSSRSTRRERISGRGTEGYSNDRVQAIKSAGILDLRPLAAWAEPDRDTRPPPSKNGLS